LQLKQEITIGDRPPGSTLPSIDELNKQTDISHGMIRKAMGMLEEEGLVFRKTRVGTIVKESPNRILWVPSSSIKEIRDRMMSDKVVPLSAGWVDVPNHVYIVFQNHESAFKKKQIYQLHFLLIAKEDERRRNLTTLFVPAWRYKEVEKTKMHKLPINTVVNDLNLVKIKQIIRPWFCDSEASKHLAIPEGTPIFHRTLIAFLADGRPLGMLEQMATVYALERDIDIQ
jgi:GntR family transcriptional regulator